MHDRGWCTSPTCPPSWTWRVSRRFWICDVRPHRPRLTYSCPSPRASRDWRGPRRGSSTDCPADGDGSSRIRGAPASCSRYECLSSDPKDCRDRSRSSSTGYGRPWVARPRDDRFEATEYRLLSRPLRFRSSTDLATFFRSRFYTPTRPIFTLSITFFPLPSTLLLR